MGKHKRYEMPNEDYCSIRNKIKEIPGMDKYHESWFIGASTSDYTYFCTEELKETGQVQVNGSAREKGLVTIDVWADFKEPLDKICNQLEDKLEVYEKSILDLSLSDILKRLQYKKRGI